ncbi:MAG: hypothetical protein ACJ8GN_02125 [Longimicrobiaceae bacterium]
MQRSGAFDCWKRAGAGLVIPAYGDESLAYRNDLYQCAGVIAPAGPSDSAELAECEGTGAATGSFEPYIFAYRVTFGLDGTITSIGGYAEGGGGALFTFWVAVWTDATSLGNPVPGAPGSGSWSYEHPGAGFDGEKLRAGAVSVPVVAGESKWFLTQTKTSAQQRGYRRSSAFRTIFGENAATTLTATSCKNYIGLRSSAQAPYNAAIASLPAMTLLPAGDDTVRSGDTATILRPTVYFKFVRS